MFLYWDIYVVECILIRSNRISRYYDWIRYFITKTFARFNYKDKLNWLIFLVSSIKLLVTFVRYVLFTKTQKKIFSLV